MTNKRISARDVLKRLMSSERWDDLWNLRPLLIDDIQRLLGPGNPTQLALDTATKPLHAEIERLQGALEHIAYGDTESEAHCCQIAARALDARHAAEPSEGNRWCSIHGVSNCPHDAEKSGESHDG